MQITEQAKFIEDVFFNSMIIIQNHTTLSRTYSTGKDCYSRLSTKVALSINAINTFIGLKTAFIYNSPRIASKHQGFINPRRLQFSKHGSQVLPFANEHQTTCGISILSLVLAFSNLFKIYLCYEKGHFEITYEKQTFGIR
uniref:Uncharacterized protein n=1 Tax=Caenorhabditis japonica TaxID=281687 RepID=A0A8R1ELC1_CAEJA